MKIDAVPQWTSYHLHNNLAIFYFKKKEFYNSTREFGEVWRSISNLEKKNPMLGKILVQLNYNMAWVYQQWRKPDKAVEHYTEAVKMASLTYGEDH
jgi:tetratricopeptide (TPR) repeat protein